MSRKIKSLITFLILVQSISALAQSGVKNNYDLNSPYSRFGIGDLIYQGSVRNIGMGGTGTCQSHPEFFNIINPALLINNRVTHYDSLQSLLDGSIGAIINTSKADNGNQTSGSINFNSFAYALPVSKRWTSSIGLRKFSNVSYNIQTTQKVSGTSADSALVIYRGNGGIYQGDFSNAYRLNKYFNLGLSTSYLFGSANKESLSQLQSQPDSNLAGINNRLYYNGILIKPGFSLRFPVNKAHDRDSIIFFNLGATYEFYANMSADNRVLAERRNRYNSLLSETVISDVNQSLKFPGTFRGGISLDKSSDWNIAADFSYSDYSKYKGTNNLDTFKNSYSIFLGGEYGYLKKEFREGSLEQEKNKRRQYFRAGLMYSKTPLFINNTQIHDFAITLGYTLQLGKPSKFITRPKLNFALVAGQRGTMKNLLVKDQYYKLYIGFTLSEKWFRKRKID